MKTKFTILNDPTARNHAYMMSKWAIDIQYDCPKCGKDRVVTWLFPDQDMLYVDECCGQKVHFEGFEDEGK